MALIKGTIAPGVTKLEIKNTNAPKHAKPVKVVIHKGKFKALVELSVGPNVLQLSTDKKGTPLSFEINYKPQTNPNYVRLVWMTDKSGDATYAVPEKDIQQDYESRLRTAALLMQTFTAERMNDLGYGHRTFRLERDSQGQVIIHTLKGSQDRQFYYDLGDTNNWWREVYRWINREHPDPLAKNIVLAAYTRKDPETGKMKGHTALGGGNLGLFGSASVFSWPQDISSAVDVFQDATRVDPKNVHDDSAFRNTNWGLASTTIGATLHEMGHTFGLPHCTDRLGIMTRGFDRFKRVFTFYDPPSKSNREARYFPAKEEAYFAPISAGYLRWSPWFRLDKPEEKNPQSPNANIKISIDAKKETVEISSEDGIGWIGYWVGTNVQTFQEYQAPNNPKKVTYTMKEISQKLNGKPLSKISTISTSGKSAVLKVPQ